MRSDGSAVVSREDGARSAVRPASAFSVGPLEIGAGATSRSPVAAPAAGASPTWAPPGASSGRAAGSGPDRPRPARRALDVFGARGEVSAGATVRSARPVRVAARADRGGRGRRARRRRAGYSARRPSHGRRAHDVVLPLEARRAGAYAALPAWAPPCRAASPWSSSPRTLAGCASSWCARRARRAGGGTSPIARLDLRDPAIRSRLGDGAPWPPSVLREPTRLAATRGVVERQVFAVDDRSDTFARSGKLGVALGLNAAGRRPQPARRRRRLDRRLGAAAARGLLALDDAGIAS